MEIYLIENLLNNKKYVGQTKYTKEYRFEGHLRGNQYIDKAIKKYGKENFKLSTLETVENEDDLNEREIYWIKKENTISPNGYNLTEGGAGKYETPLYEIQTILKNMFFPTEGYKISPKRVKLVMVDRNDLREKIYKYINLDNLQQTNVPLYMDLYFDFETMFKKYLKQKGIRLDFLEDITYKVLYYPSIKAIYKYPPKEKKGFLSAGEAAYAVKTSKWLDCCVAQSESGLYNSPEEEYSSYVCIVFDCEEEEYSKWANSKIEELIEYYKVHTKEMKKFIKEDSLRRKKTSSCTATRQIQTNKNKEWVLWEEIKMHFPKCRTKSTKDGRYIITVIVDDENLIFESTISKLDALKKAYKTLFNGQKEPTKTQCIIHLKEYWNKRANRKSKTRNN